MKRFIKLLDDHLEEWMLILLECAIVLVMLLQIVRRYVFNASLTWSEEFCRYCFIWFMFIGYSYSIHEKIDLRMDAVLNILPEKLKTFVVRFGLVFCFGLTLLLFVNSFTAVGYVMRTGERSTGMHLPMYVVYASMIVGFGMAVIRYIQRILEEFRGKGGEKK